MTPHSTRPEKVLKMNLTNRGATPPLRDPNQAELDKAFHLASFIHAHLGKEERRRVAIEIVSAAARAFKVAATRQRKRLYYNLSGQISRSPDEETVRNKASRSGLISRWWAEKMLKRKARTKVTLETPHLLQCLVFEKSEKWERRQEETASGIPLSHSDMLVRYVAFIVRTTIERCSFYVTLGLCRFVYSYNATQTRRLYEFIIQDSRNRAKAGEYFHNRKGELRKEILGRFGPSLTLVTGARGEKYFRRAEGSEGLSELLKECLDEFQPWEGECVLPDRFNRGDKLPMLKFEGREDDDSPVELRRMHSLIHPECFARLVKAQKFNEPEKCLGLPLFSLRDSQAEG